MVVVPCHKELRHRRNDGHVIRRRGMNPQRRWRWSCHTEERHGPTKKTEDKQKDVMRLCHKGLRHNKKKTKEVVSQSAEA